MSGGDELKEVEGRGMGKERRSDRDLDVDNEFLRSISRIPDQSMSDQKSRLEAEMAKLEEEERRVRDWQAVQELQRQVKERKRRLVDMVNGAQGGGDGGQKSEGTKVQVMETMKRKLESPVTPEEKRRKSSEGEHSGNSLDDDTCNSDQTQEYDIEQGVGIKNGRESYPIASENTQEYKNVETDADLGNKDQRNEPEVSSSTSKNGVDEVSQGTKPNLSKIQSVQKDAELISGIVCDADADTLYEKVLKHRADKNRVDVVTNEVLENMMNANATDSSTNVATDSSTNVATNSEEQIFEEVAKVLEKYPSVDPNKVYGMLEKLDNSTDRVASVLDQLSKETTTSSDAKIASSEPKSTCRWGPDRENDPAFNKNHPIYKDLKTLRKALPDRAPAELYAYLEAHFDKGNRVQIVIDELTKSDSQESLSVPASFEDLDRGKQPATLGDRLQNELQELKEIFPDCDPNFLFDKLDGLKGEPEKVKKIAADLFENRQYPKLQERLDKERKDEKKRQIRKMQFDLHDFLQKFPDPVPFFEDAERKVCKNYQDHTLAYLKNTYPYLKDGFIRKVLDESKHHLTLAVKQVEGEHLEPGRRSKKMRVAPREEVLEYPEEPDELFFQEVLFCLNRQKIIDHLDDKAKVRDQKVQEAKDKGELFECGCCYDDECLFEEMGACADGHIFCKECISRSTEAAVGEGKTKFPCLTGTCEQQFPLPMLQEVLAAKTFSLLLRKLQEEELRAADIADLVSCPFCSFATIMPDPDDKVFTCLNPDCLKLSCRLCKEPNHVPLRCNEVEKQGETNMRTYIETKMSEAMLRTCPNCKKRFVKEHGCNKMTCTCGTTMCYVCRESNIDYGHFDGDRCKIDSDIFSLHNNEMLKAAEDARQEFLRDHPDQDTQLKYDPVKLLEQMKARYGAGMGADGDEGDEYDEGDDDDGYDDDEYY